MRLYLILFLFTCNFTQSILAQNSRPVGSFKDTATRQILESINWIENTPLDSFAPERKQRNTIILKWLLDNRSLYDYILEDFVPSSDNGELVMIFVGGFTHYYISNPDSANTCKAIMEGLKSYFRVYQKDPLIKKSQDADAKLEMAKNGQLEDWIARQLKQRQRN